MAAAEAGHLSATSSSSSSVSCCGANSRADPDSTSSSQSFHLPHNQVLPSRTNCMHSTAWTQQRTVQLFCRPCQQQHPGRIPCVQVYDAPAAPATGRSVGKVAIDQTSSRDTYAESDSPRKAAPSPRPAALDAPASIWEKLASHEVGCTQHTVVQDARLTPQIQPPSTTRSHGTPVVRIMQAVPGLRTAHSRAKTAAQHPTRCGLPITH